MFPKKVKSKKRYHLREMDLISGSLTKKLPNKNPVQNIGPNLVLHRIIFMIFCFYYPKSKAVLN